MSKESRVREFDRSKVLGLGYDDGPRHLPQIAHEVWRYALSGDAVLTPESFAYDLETLRVAIRTWEPTCNKVQAWWDECVRALITEAVAMVEQAEKTRKIANESAASVWRATADLL